MNEKQDMPDIEEIKKLDGKIFAMLSEEETKVLNFFRHRGRKYGVEISIINEADPDELKNAKSKEQGDAILKSANSRISVIVS